jgi:hypothetical protein
MRIRISAGDWGGEYEAATGPEAIVLFFDDVLAGKIKLCQLGLAGNWSDGGEPIPFRIAPALFKAGRLNARDLAASFQAAGLDFEPAEIMSIVTADAWMVRQGPLPAREVKR